MRLDHVAAGLVMIAMAMALPRESDAGWLSRLVREAAEGGGGVASKIGKTGVGALDNAAAHVASLPKISGSTALAAHVTPEGHWKFANRESQIFTAASPDELARVGTALAPDAAPGGKLAVYLSEDTAFAQPAAIKELPPDADLHVVMGKDAYRLQRSGSSGDTLAVEFRPNVVVTLTDRVLFEEAVYRLSRPLSRSNIRALALETGGPSRLSTVPRYDPATKAALVDQVDPAALPGALESLKGQTALVSGRIDGGSLTFRPSSGSDRTLDIAKLVKAAEDADVNLVLLQTGSTHQPGGRNWLWQTVTVSGLDDALKRATFADFLSALGGTGSELTVKAAPGSIGRVVFSVVPMPTASTPLSETLGGWIGWNNWLSDMTGNVAVKAAEIYARDESRERELDARLIPGIPAAVQYAYLGSLVAGLIGWQVSSPWWSRIWPPERRQEYAGRLGYWAARAARLSAYVGLFLPLVGIPALLWFGLLQLWTMITWPFRAVSWVMGRFSARRA